MRKTEVSLSLVVPLALLGLIVASATGVAQTGTIDHLARLKGALQDAGAPELSSAQETTLNALITSFRTAHQPVADTAVETARNAYRDAILNGSSAAAVTQAQIIANAEATRTLQVQTDAAVFGINVLNVLKTNGSQVSALTGKFGTSGLVRLVLSLAGGPGGPGMRGGGPGPEGFLPPR
jgi:hypothetical protein